MSEKVNDEKNIRYSGYWPGDEVRSVEFFRALGYSHTLDFWRWSNRARLIQYAEMEQSIIAHYGVQPRLVRIGTNILQGGMGIHFGAHPEYGGVPVLVETFNRIEERCKKVGINFIFGFPNENSWPFLNRMLGWEKVSDVTALKAPIETLSEGNSGVRSKLPDFKRWHSVKHKNFFIEGAARVEKNESHLNWRYKECPNKPYSLVQREKKGFIVLKIYKKDGKKCGHILEWGADAGDQKTQTNLFYDAIRVFRDKGVDIVSTWMNKLHPLFNILYDEGLRQSGFTTNLGYKALSPDVPNLENRNWLISMGDSDAF